VQKIITEHSGKLLALLAVVSFMLGMKNKKLNLRIQRMRRTYRRMKKQGRILPAGQKRRQKPQQLIIKQGPGRTQPAGMIQPIW